MERKRVRNGVWAVLLALCMVVAGALPVTVRGAITDAELEATVLQICREEKDNGVYGVKLFCYSPTDSWDGMEFGNVKIYFHYGDSRNYQLADKDGNILANDQLSQSVELSDDLEADTVPPATISIDSNGIACLSIQLNACKRKTDAKSETHMATIYCVRRTEGTEPFTIAANTDSRPAASIEYVFGTAETNASDYDRLFLLYTAGQEEKVKDYFALLKDIYNFCQKRDKAEYPDEDEKLAAIEKKMSDLQDAAKNSTSLEDLQAAYDEIRAYHETCSTFASEEERISAQNIYIEEVVNYIKTTYGKEISEYRNHEKIDQTIEKYNATIKALKLRSEMKNAVQSAKNSLDGLVEIDRVLTEWDGYFESISNNKKIDDFENSTDILRAIEKGGADIQECETVQDVRRILASAKNTLDCLVAKDSALVELRAYRSEEVTDANRETYESQLEKGLGLITKARTQKEVENAGKTARAYIDAVLGQGYPQRKNGFYQIGTARDLLWLKQQCNGENDKNIAVADLDVELTADIDLADLDETEKENFRINSFSGVFDGKNHVVKNFQSDGSLFGSMSGTLRNLTVEGTITNHKATDTLGGVVGQNSGRVENCVNKVKITCTDAGNGSVAAPYCRVGGISGINSGIIERCVNEGDIELTGRYVGGIAGNNGGEISQCENRANIDCTVGTDTHPADIGGIAAITSNVIRYCRNSGALVGEYVEKQGSQISTVLSVGGIVGSGCKTVYGNYSEGSISLDKSAGEDRLVKHIGAVVGQGWDTDYPGRKMELYGNYYLAGIRSEDCPQGVGTWEEDEENAVISVADAAKLTEQDIWNLNSGCGYVAGEGIWALSGGELAYAGDGGAAVYKVSVSPELRDYVRLEHGSETCEEGYAYVSGKQKFRIVIKKDGYTFKKLAINGENESDSAEGRNAYRLICAGGYDVSVDAELDGTKPVSDCKKAIEAIGTVTNRNERAVRDARRAYDELFESDRQELGDAADTLAEAERASAFLKRVSVTLKETVYTSDGQGKEPEAEVYVSDPNGQTEKKLLAAGKDYTVSYENNIRPGTATAVVTFVGDYASPGKYLVDFTISQPKQDNTDQNKPDQGSTGQDKPDNGQPQPDNGSRETDIRSASIVMKKSYTHTGKALTPAMTVKLGDTVLKAGEDYTAAYKNNKEPGTATVTVSGTGKYSGTAETIFIIKAAKGKTYTVGSLEYKVTKANAAKGTVSVSGVKRKTVKSVSVPEKVKIGNYSYTVTAIGSNAFKNCKSLQKAAIGKNVKQIGSGAFYGDKKLKTITVKGKSLSGVGKNALKGIADKAVVKVPSSKLVSYKKLFKNKGQAKTVKVRK